MQLVHVKEKHLPALFYSLDEVNEYEQLWTTDVFVSGDKEPLTTKVLA